jgi:hypothetical protein
MKAFFEGTQWLFENILFVPQNFLRELELTNWFLANIINWVAIIVCGYYMVYWCKQLKIHQENGEENQDTSAHSFLNK